MCALKSFACFHHPPPLSVAALPTHTFTAHRITIYFSAPLFFFAATPHRTAPRPSPRFLYSHSFFHPAQFPSALPRPPHDAPTTSLVFVCSLSHRIASSIPNYLQPPSSHHIHYISDSHLRWRTPLSIFVCVPVSSAACLPFWTGPALALVYPGTCACRTSCDICGRRAWASPP